MMKSIALLMVSVLAVGVSSEATLLVYEGFDYPVGSLNGQGVAGDGWVGAWSSSANYDVVTSSLAMANLPFVSTGGSIIGHNTANRAFNGVDFAQEGVYYVSYIVQRTGWGATDGGGEAFDFHLRTTSYARAAAVGISSSETFETIELGNAVRAGDAATTNSYFLVAKVVTHATAADEIFLKAYSTADTVDISEATSWTVTGDTEECDLLSNMITLWAGTDDDADGLYQAAIDEIRIGTTWGDVVPEQIISDLIVYEGFDYPVGSLDDLGASAEGWLGAWNTANYNVVNDSLTMPNLPFHTTGGSAIGQNVANRTFTGVDFSQEGVYYASFILQRSGWGAADGGGEWTDLLFRTTGYARVAGAGISSGEEFHTVELGSSVAGGDAATTNPYFLVTKIVTHTNAADEIYLKAYSISDTIDLSEPTGWTVSGGTEESDLLAGMITLYAGTDDDEDGLYQVAIDEIRVGRTWAIVVPSTLNLPATIVSLKPFGSNTLEMVVNVSNPSVSYPKGMDDLVVGSWTNVGHSIDGNVPFVETNLTYSTPSGQNKVIYLEADEASKFFKIDTGE